MPRLIDANALKGNFMFLRKMWSGTEICAVIDESPTVDAVEVVYCKNCKSHHWEQEPCHGKTVHICSKLNAEITRDFYCGAGERKDNERTD